MSGQEVATLRADVRAAEASAERASVAAAQAADSVSKAAADHEVALAAIVAGKSGDEKVRVCVLQSDHAAEARQSGD